MFVMKKIQLSIQQDHAKTEEPVRYVKRNTLEIYMDSYLKGKSSNDVLILMIQL